MEKIMHILNFKNDAKGTLSKLVAFASAHPRKKPYTKTTTKELGVWLVKDDGIYLMSSTDKKFCLSEKDMKNDKAPSTVVYAQGYKPTKANRETLWYKTHDVSGDDFAEFIPLEKGQVDRIVNKNGNLKIKLCETKLFIEA
tara:strand:- start:1489 stop:1911 length:423 start_codon:yes stop_codon:yes gene_type:complete